MIKFVYCVKKRPELSDEEFRRYWLEQHGPLVRSKARILKARKYVQSHLLPTPLNDAAREPRGCQPAYDGITELWWDSHEELLAVIQTAEGQQANLELGADEARFVDLANSSVFFTEEHCIFDYGAP